MTGDDVKKDFSKFLESFPQKDVIYTAKKILDLTTGRLQLNNAVQRFLLTKNFDREMDGLIYYSYARLEDKNNLRVICFGNPFLRNWSRHYFLKDEERPFQVVRSSLVEEAQVQIEIVEDEKQQSNYQLVLPYFEMSLQIEFLPNPFSSREERLTALESGKNTQWMMLDEHIVESLAHAAGYALPKERSPAREHFEDIHAIWVQNMSTLHPLQKKIILGK